MSDAAETLSPMKASSAPTGLGARPIVHHADQGAIATALAAHGYARVAPSFLGAAISSRHLTAFLDSCQELPPDLHARDSVRHRRHGRFLLNSVTHDLAPMPPVDAGVSLYRQSPHSNPEQAGQWRSFAALTSDQYESPFLISAIMLCFAALPALGPVEIEVGVHVVKNTARPGRPGRSTPNHLHQDGEPFTWAFLLSRGGVIGGENVFAEVTAAGNPVERTPSSQVIDRFVLLNPLQGWVVDDRRVSHYVSPVEVVTGAMEGHRTVLLIDFTPREKP